VLATYLKEIYDFDSKKQIKVKLLRIFAIVIAILVLCRVVNDMYSYFSRDWQSTFKVTSFCNRNPLAALYIFFYVVLADILPQTLFLLIFSPTTREKPKSSSLQNEEDSFPNYGSEGSNTEENFQT